MHNLARYRLVRALGSGAAGGVYLVEDRVLGGAPLALKRIEPAADRGQRDSFAREFAVLASLSLAGVGRVHDLGVVPATDTEPEGPFFTRDYVEGQSLDAWARDKSLLEQLRVFRGVLAIASQLHRRAVLHGDLHPRNIIVDTNGAPHLIDFGLASHGTHRMRASGTPLFMAPELLQGGSSSISADVYALAATLWAALTGTAPFVELGARALAAKVQGQLPSLAARGGAERALLEALLRALAPDPQKRVPSADELSALLERALGVGLASAPERLAFVAPRPRGREPLSAVLGQLADTACSPRGITILHGDRGIGKSTLLRELKWRLQLEGAPVLEIRCRDGLGSALAQLARQLKLFDDRVDAWSQGTEEGPSADERAVSRTMLAAALCAPPGRRYTVLIDDLEDATGTFVELLSEVGRVSELRAPSERLPLVVASCATLAAPALAALVDLEGLPIEPLGELDVRALIVDSLGPVDEGTLQSVAHYAQGNPGLLLEVLAWSWRRGDVGLELGQLEPGALGASLLEQQLAGLSVHSRDVLSLLALARGPLRERYLAHLLHDGYGAARSELIERRLVQVDERAVFAADARISDYLRSGAAAHAPALAERALQHASSADLEPLAMLEFALVAGDRQRAAAALPAVLDALHTQGAASDSSPIVRRLSGTGSA